MTRRILALITALCLVFGMVPAAFAEEPEAPAPDSGTCGENLTWTFEPDTGTLTVSGTGAMADYEVPNGSESDSPWYPYASEITAVVVEEGVTTIGEDAFYWCENLTDLTLPSTLVSIGHGAFGYCSIAEVDLPEGLLTLAGFNGNPITEVVIPDSVTTIDDNTFTECSELTSVILPSSLEYLGTRAFSSCINLSQIVMPQMPNFQSFGMMGSIFSGCAFTDLDWYTLSEIGYQMFNSNAFVELEIPECVTIVNDFAFEGCDSMTKVTVPAGVTYLGSVAFGSCTALEEVYFLGDAPELGADLVQRLTDVTFYYPAGNETWTADVRNTYDGVVTWVAYDYENGEISPDQPEDPTEPEPDYIHSGVYNGNINWSYNENSGLLSLSGAGEMPEPEDIFYPWDDYRDLYSHVDIGEDMTHIGVRCFASSTNLHEITVPGNIQHIGVSAFSYSNIRHAYIEDGVQTIGDSAFYNSYVETVQMPASLAQTELVTTFEGCANLASVAVPEGIETLFETFDGCTSLTEVTLPGTLRTISLSAFEGCHALTSIELPEGLESIDDYAFADTASLSELTIPSTVTYIGSEAFGSVSWYDGEEFHYGISTIRFTGDAPSFTEYSFAGYPDDHEGLTCYYPAGNDTWTEDVLQQYGGNVTWIAEGEEPEPSEPQPGDTPDNSGTWGDNIVWELDGTTLYISGEGNMFVDSGYPWTEYAETVTHLVIEEGVTSLGDYAFYGFSALTDASIPGTIEYFGIAAMGWCTSLRNVTIGEGVTRLGTDLFGSCSSLKQITLPSTLIEIGQRSFFDSGLTSIVIPESVYSIKSEAFQFCEDLESVTLPSQLTSMGYSCFSGCKKLKEIELPDNLSGIPQSCFDNSGLTHITLPDYIVVIGDSAFQGCADLASVDFPAHLERIESRAFMDCTKLESVMLPETLREIGAEAFHYSGLTMISIPNGVIRLGDRAFANCSRLEAVLIPDSVTDIGENVFSNCPTVNIYCRQLTFAHLYALAYELPVEILEDEPNTPVYDVILDCGPGGTAIVAPNPSPANRFILLEIQADKGYVLESVFYEVANNPDQEIYYEQVSDTVVAFFMPESDLYLDVYFVSEKSPFTDVKESDYFYDPVRWAVSRGITTGMGNGKFAPNSSCTRAQVVTFLWRAAGEPEPMSGNNPFKDVKSSDYFYKAVLWAVENGITTGMSATSFGPNSPCTRGQVVTFLYRAAGGTGSDYGHNPFRDVKPTDYYYDAVLWAVENGITTGMSATSFAPNSTCTRGQVVTFLFRFLY